MASRLRREILPAQKSGLLPGALTALLAVAVVTLLIYPIKEVAPAVSTGVIYLLAVLLVSSIWGLRLGIVTALLSALAFNFFHIPPTGRLTINEPENWVALAVLLVTAVVVSSIAELARGRARIAEQRRREAELTAELARLFSAAPVESACARAAAMTASALDLEEVEISLGSYAVEGPAMRVLRRGGAPVAVLRYKGKLDDDARTILNETVVPALEALIAAGLEREDLTAEVVEKEALERSDEIKTSLLRAVSHDLRTPLTAITAAAEALQSETISEADRKALAEAVGQESVRLTSLVEKLLDLSRIQAGEVSPRRDWCAIDEIAQAVVDQAVSEGGTVDLAVDSELPLVRADGALIERALANLIENGVRHSGGKPVSVHLRSSGRTLLVRVVDQGPGIAAAELDSIFMPFERSGESTGAGLGLAIVRGMVEANDGTVWAESLPGQGSTFTIKLPVEEVPARQPEAAS